MPTAMSIPAPPAPPQLKDVIATAPGLAGPAGGATPQALTPQPVVPTIPGPAILRADQRCPGGALLVPRVAPPMVEAQVTGFVTRSQAMALVQVNQQEVHGFITPRYINNQRVNVAVGLDGSTQATVLVPQGMTVALGETVTFVGGHADPDRVCHYIPNLIVQAFPGHNR